MSRLTKDEALGIASRIWCLPQHQYKAMDPDLAESIADELLYIDAQRENWEQTAGHYLRGSDYYRSLLVKIGELWGKDAMTTDDGSVYESVLVGKVPELVERLFNDVKPTVIVEVRN